MTKTTMTIGLFDKDTEQQEISTAAANEIIAQTLIDEYHIFAFTAWECAGAGRPRTRGGLDERVGVYGALGECRMGRCS